MKGITKLGLTLVTMGGACMMVAPAAFADDLSAFQGVGAGAYQTQDGSGAGDAILNQNSTIQLGQVQASNYYNNQNTFGFNTSSNTGTTTDGVNSNSTSTADQNFGGNSITSADSWAQQQAQVTQSQSQQIGNWYDNTYNNSYDNTDYYGSGDENTGTNTGTNMGGGTGGVQEQGGGAISLQDTSGLLGFLFYGGMNGFVAPQ
jgi:hypothetical protein